MSRGPGEVKPGDTVLGLRLAGPKPGAPGSAIGWALVRPPSGVHSFGHRDGFDPAEEALMLARNARAKVKTEEVSLDRYADRAALARSEHARHDDLLQHWELIERTRRLLLADGFRVTIKDVR